MVSPKVGRKHGKLCFLWALPYSAGPLCPFHTPACLVTQQHLLQLTWSTAHTCRAFGCFLLGLKKIWHFHDL